MSSTRGLVFDGYHSFQNEDGQPYGSFQVFAHTAEDAELCSGGTPNPDKDDSDQYAPGWYWWACLPGCLPDGEPNGPFDTAKAAWEDARNT